MTTTTRHHPRAVSAFEKDSSWIDGIVIDVVAAERRFLGLVFDTSAQRVHLKLTRTVVTAAEPERRKW